MASGPAGERIYGCPLRRPCLIRQSRRAGSVRTRRPGGPRVFDFARVAGRVRAVTPAVWAGSLGAVDRTAPAAYSKR